MILFINVKRVLNKIINIIHMLEENTIKELLDTLEDIEIIEIKNLYESLILKSIEEDNRGLYDNIYTEIHHIVPRCMGGSDSPENLVKLTVTNHIKAHVLLSRMYPENEKLKYAVFATTLYSEISNKTRIFTILNMDFGIISKIREDAVNARRGRRLSNETRKKISESHKGAKNSNYGKHRSEETKRKISESHKVENLSEESRRNLSNSKKGSNHPMFGKKLSEETKLKMSNSHKGENNHFYGKHHKKEVKERLSKLNTGKHHTEETARKISLGNQGKIVSEESKKKISNSRKGIIFSEETKRKMSEAKKLKREVIGPDGRNYGNLKTASKLIGISIPTLKKWIEKFPDKGYTYLITNKDN
jgi:hypothetical protein